ncbi:MAG: cysteine hydrolase [Rhodospirillaceae bacterium TMED63]|nr:MAG: cysteine hydrolase [Rhodospirillaceae bacterium TMED63]
MEASFTFQSVPYPVSVTEKKIALVVVDMQRDFLEPGGFGESLGNDVQKLRDIIPNISNLIRIFRRASLCIVHTKEGHKPDLSDCPKQKLRPAKNGLAIGDPGPMGRLLISGEPGNDFISEVSPSEGEIVITKPGKGAFYKTRLNEILRDLEISTLLFTGVTTEVCVQTSMREAADRGFQTLIVNDATASYFDEYHSSTIDMMTSQGGIVGCSVTTEQTINAFESGGL